MTERLGPLLCAGVVAALVVWAVRQPVAVAVQAPTVVFVVTNPAAGPLTRAIDRLQQTAPDVPSRLRIRVRTPASAEAEAPAADAVLCELLDDDWVDQQRDWLTAPEAPALRWSLGERRGGGAPPEWLTRSETVDAYWENGSPEQLEQLLRFVARRLGLTDLEVAPPEPPLERGLVAFSATGPVLCRDWAAWVEAQQPDLTRPCVGILEFPTRARRGELEVAQALVEAVEAQGLQPVLAFGHPPSETLRATLQDAEGAPRIQALLGLQFKFADPEAEAVLDAWGVPVLNAVTVYGRTLSEWRDSLQGLSGSEVAWQLAVPELAGLAPHTVVGGREVGRGGAVGTRAIPERVEVLAARARRWIELQQTPPAERRVALMYWNYPPGRQNVGASYLNVARSLPRLLRDLKAAGYATGAPPEGWDDLTWLERRIVERGRNIARWAPGELDALLADDGATLISLDQYEAWFAELPEDFRENVVGHWGPPSEADIMTVERDGALQFVIPTVHMGRVVLLPQPDRARTQDLEALYQSQDLPPHHQYVATYLWLQRGLEVDAVVHTGTHGTHEWLSGKEAGMSGSDPGEVLAGDLPILYPYIVDDVGEGIVAKRRGAAVVVDHLTPALGGGGLAPELEELRRALLRWRQGHQVDPEGAAPEAEEIAAEVARRGIDLDLADRGWGEDDLAPLPERLAVLEDYLEQVRVQTVPFGLHTFGRSPGGSALDGFVAIVHSANPALDPAQIAADLRACGPQETTRLLGGLAGARVPAAPGNDPARNPQAIPTGSNFYAFDPREIPSEAAWETGQRLADELFAQLEAERGAPPQKVAVQVWGVETIRHEGVQEAQALGLLGVAVRRNPNNGRIVGVELIDRETLGRPRVDVVIHATSLYRDTFPVLVELLDEAVRLAASSPEPDNPIRGHVEALVAELVEAGVPEAEARQRAGVRIFAEPSGRHDSKVAWMASASGSWDTEAQFADNYIRRMGHGYGGGLWGVSLEREFRAALSGTEAIVHSRASSLYATLDNDDYFSYGGSIAIGVRRVDGGESPPFLVSDLRRAGEERHVPLERFMGQELRSRYLNPAFVEGMTAEGYAGARHVWKATEYLWGWQVVYPEAVDGAKWQELFEVWVEDRYELELDAFFDASNPHARQGIVARMLETVRKGYWEASEETLQTLTEEYVAEVVEHGVACDHLTCDDPDLQQFVREQAARFGLDPELVEAWTERVERATQRTLEERLEARTEGKARWHQTPSAEPAEAEPASGEVEGYVMEEVSAPPPPQVPSEAPGPWWGWIVAAALLAGAAREGVR